MTVNPANSLSQEDTSRAAWDHGSHEEFYDYYAAESLSDTTTDRFRRWRDVILALPELRDREGPLDVADIGCGAGTQVMLWSERGHRVRGLDVNEPLIELARRRASEQGHNVTFEIGSATQVPWEDESVDVCLVPELLEHVADWQACLDEFARILRPGGLLYISTTNKLCPYQEEFRLPLYSWYPGFLKRRYEKLAITTRPEIANHAIYPATNWFTPYGLESALKRRGFDRAMDRFDIAWSKRPPGVRGLVLAALRAIPPLRFLGHCFSASSIVVGFKSR